MGQQWVSQYPEWIYQFLGCKSKWVLRKLVFREIICTETLNISYYKTNSFDISHFLFQNGLKISGSLFNHI
jgi:hypothetical protein